MNLQERTPRHQTNADLLLEQLRRRRGPPEKTLAKVGYHVGPTVRRVIQGRLQMVLSKNPLNSGECK